MQHTNDTQEYVRQFGRRVRVLRENLLLSQEELAHRAGVHRTYIGMVERGEKNVTIVSIVKLSAALEVKPAELFADLDVA